MRAINSIYIPLFMRVLKHIKENPTVTWSGLSRDLNSTSAYIYKLKKEFIKRNIVISSNLRNETIEFTEDGLFLAELCVEIIKRTTNEKSEIIKPMETIEVKEE